jgi:phosphate/sulfate permease
MRHYPSHTVDISAEPVSAFAPPVNQRRDFTAIIRQSLGVDIFLVFISLLVGLLFSSAIGAVVAPVNPAGALLIPPQWLIFAACALPSVLCLLLDTLSMLSNPVALPFARSKNSLQAIYAKRLHLILLAFYFTTILVALCWSALTMPLLSKLFVSAIFGFALYALGQSIPSTRLSFIVSGILFLVVLVATQAFIVLRLEANTVKANQEALDKLVAPEDDKKSSGDKKTSKFFEGDTSY